MEEDEGGVTVLTEGGNTVRALAAVIATNSPINDRVAIHTKQAPYRTYAMAFTIPRGEMPDGLYWDTLDVYHYVRLQPGPGTADYLIVGGADHKTGEADDAWARFEGAGILDTWTCAGPSAAKRIAGRARSWTRSTTPVLSAATPATSTSMWRTGDSGQGMTHGVVASLLIPRAYHGRRQPLGRALRPLAQGPFRRSRTSSRENVTAVKNFAEYVAPGELKSVDELKPGQGAIVREGLTKVAAYRDEQGQIQRRSAACTHLGCHVHWNSLERCWDCPCHGSHFAVDGTALNAPAVAPLAPLTGETGSARKKASERV